MVRQDGSSDTAGASEAAGTSAHIIAHFTVKV